MRARFLVALVPALLSGCSTLGPPKITPVATKATNINAEGLEIEVTFDAENTTSIDLAARSVTAMVVLGKSPQRWYTGTMTTTQRIDLPAQKKTRFDVPVTYNWPDAMKLLIVATHGNADCVPWKRKNPSECELGKDKDVAYEVEGTVAVGNDSVRFNVPFHMNGTLSREMLLKTSWSKLGSP